MKDRDNYTAIADERDRLQEALDQMENLRDEAVAALAKAEETIRQQADRLAALVDSAAQHRLDIEGLSAQLAEALGTADGYREACDRAEAERDDWHHKCDVAVASVAHIETERDHLVEQRGTLQEYANAGYAENERLRAQLAEAQATIVDLLAENGRLARGQEAAREECGMLAKGTAKAIRNLAKSELDELTRLRAVEAAAKEWANCWAHDWGETWPNYTDDPSVGEVVDAILRGEKP